MPFLIDGGPPVGHETVERARTELPREYGFTVVTERGRKVMLVRVPRAKPDYNYELQEVSLYVSTHDLKDVKDVLLVGDEKVVRMEPVRLRDHVRDQMVEDADVAKRLRNSLARSGDGWTVVPSEVLHHHRLLVFRLAAERLADATDEHFRRAKGALGSSLVATLRDVDAVLFITDTDYGRVGRRVFVDGVAPEVATQVPPRGGDAANPSHLAFATAGGTLKPGQQL